MRAGGVTVTCEVKSRSAEDQLSGSQLGPYLSDTSPRRNEQKSHVVSHKGVVAICLKDGGAGPRK